MLFPDAVKLLIVPRLTSGALRLPSLMTQLHFGHGLSRRYAWTWFHMSSSWEDLAWWGLKVYLARPVWTLHWCLSPSTSCSTPLLATSAVVPTAAHLCLHCTALCSKLSLGRSFELSPFWLSRLGPPVFHSSVCRSLFLFLLCISDLRFCWVWVNLVYPAQQGLLSCFMRQHHIALRNGFSCFSLWDLFRRVCLRLQLSSTLDCTSTLHSAQSVEAFSLNHGHVFSVPPF